MCQKLLGTFLDDVYQRSILNYKHCFRDNDNYFEYSKWDIAREK